MGKRKTAKKAAASRRNGKLGGRPPKKKRRVERAVMPAGLNPWRPNLRAVLCQHRCGGIYMRDEAMRVRGEIACSGCGEVRRVGPGEGHAKGRAVPDRCAPGARRIAALAREERKRENRALA